MTTTKRARIGYRPGGAGSDHGRLCGLGEVKESRIAISSGI